MIEVQSLSRVFGPIVAVDSLSFKVERGEVLGFLGPNGAGKSTTMKMLTCYLTPSAGTAKLQGWDILTDSLKVRAAVGYLPENAPLYGEMTVQSFLRFVAEVRGIDEPQRSERVDKVVELTRLGDVRDQTIETLSKGFRRRVGLAQALVHDPEILILDEPTDGLDPNQKHEIRTLIRQMSKDKCIILSTHILEEVEEVCTRALIIARGKIVADGTPDELRQRSRSFGTVRMKIPVEHESTVKIFLARHATRFHYDIHGPENGVHLWTLSFTEKISPTERSSAVVTLLRELQSAGIGLRDLRVDPGNLDEVFRVVTQNLSTPYGTYRPQPGA